MTCTLLDVQQLNKYITRKLGGSAVCVELSKTDIDGSVEDAFFWWSAYHGWYKEHALSIVQDQVEYDLSAVDPCVSNVMKVWFTIDPLLDFSRTYPGFLDVDGVPYADLGFSQSQGGFYSGIVQWLQTREIAARVLSADRDWWYNLDTQILHITPPGIESGAAVVLYSTPFKKEFLAKVPAEHAWLIRERALAEAKYTLGRIRGKYTGGLPAAQGNVSLDGADLIREAQEDFERIETKMIEMTEPPGILVM